MDFGKNIVLNFLEKIFDAPRKKRDNLIEYEFNCISEKCSGDYNKFNLFYNTEKNKFHCWKCGYKGNVSDLLKKYGNVDELELISSIIKDLKITVSKTDLQEQKKKITLPEGFMSFKNYDENNSHFKNALKYLEGRGVGKKEINKYKLGISTKGKYRFRVIVPSFDSKGELNYFDSRSFYPNIKPDYMKPDKEIVKKTDIIFNEKNISFYSPIYLIEGVFDMFPIFNCVPLLGKKINNVLLNKIIKYKTPVVLCLDEDAIEDVVKIFELLNSFNIQVYWCPIKDDLAKIYEEQGKSGIIKTLKDIKKMNLKTVISLKMAIKENKKMGEFLDKKEFQKNWELIKKAHGNG